MIVCVNACSVTAQLLVTVIFSNSHNKIPFFKEVTMVTNLTYITTVLSVSFCSGWCPVKGTHLSTDLRP